MVCKSGKFGRGRTNHDFIKCESSYQFLIQLLLRKIIFMSVYLLGMTMPNGAMAIPKKIMYMNMNMSMDHYP